MSSYRNYFGYQGGGEEILSIHLLPVYQKVHAPRCFLEIWSFEYQVALPPAVSYPPPVSLKFGQDRLGTGNRNLPARLFLSIDNLAMINDQCISSSAFT
jgi:hypothetical protein